MTEDNGQDGKKNGKSIGKGHELVLNHKGNMVPKHLAEHSFKPGVSGNPLGKPKRVKKKGFAEYLGEFFEDEIPVTVDGKMELWPRAKYLAHSIGEAAMKSNIIPLRKECIGIVIDTLWPKPKDVRPFIQITEHHDNRAIGFFTHVEKLADGRQITPAIMLEALESEVFDEETLNRMYPDESEEGEAPTA